MARTLPLLDAAQRREFDSPPRFTSAQRQIFFSLPEWAELLLRAMSAPHMRGGFVLQLGYFKASGRFFSVERFAAAQRAYVQHYHRLAAVEWSRDSVYVNLHTAPNPGGEIQGQVLRGARDLNLVLATQPAVLAATGFSAAPKPAQEAVTVSFEARSPGPGTLSLTDMLGRKIITRSVGIRTGANQTVVPLSGITPGVYMLTVELAGSRLTTRLVTQ